MAITETRSGSGAHAEDMPENGPDPEVPAKARRRRHRAEYKLQILEEADRTTEPGQVGALLRREGLYSSHLAAWREQRREGTLAGLAQSRGRKAKDARDRKIEELERDCQRPPVSPVWRPLKSGLMAIRSPGSWPENSGLRAIRSPD